MRWRRPTDFHGGRKYDQEPRNPGIGQLRMAGLLFADWVKRQLGWMLRSNTDPKLARTLLTGGADPFSLLGAPNGERAPHAGQAPAPARNREFSASERS